MVQFKLSGLPADQLGGHPVILAEHCAPSGVMQSPDDKPAQPVHVPGGFEQSFCPLWHSLFKAEVQYTSEPD